MNELSITCFLSLVRTRDYLLTAQELSITQQSLNRGFCRQNENTVFHGKQYENDILIHKLRCGELDVAIISEAQLFIDRELKYTYIVQEDISLFAPTSIVSDTIDSECWGLPYIHTSSWTWSFLEWQRIGRKEAQDLGLYSLQLKRAPNLWSVFSDLQINEGVFVNDNEFGHCRRFDFLKAFSLNRTSYLCCVWCKSNENPLIEHFVNHMCESYLLSR